ncbi:MAG: glycoside hydrolase family 2 TIM barrel-domain containing protein [Rikenellaceae bacterium]
MNNLKLFSITLLAALSAIFTAKGDEQLFNKGWQFHLNESDNPTWVDVSLPHTANIEPLLVNDQWQGLCFYRKEFDIEEYSSDKNYYFEFEGAMNHITIYINGIEVKQAQGGYLPVVIDATANLKASGNIMEITLDNRDNAVTGPKPLSILDFNMYGGLYRNAKLITKNKSHISHPILADRTASGGLFISTPVVDKQLSEVKIQTHVINQTDESRSLKVNYQIFDNEGLVAEGQSSAQKMASYGNGEFVEFVNIENPKLWSPSEPNLYRAVVELYDGATLLDKEESTFGIRKFEFRDNQLYINGIKTYLRGVNRHQEYPHIGYALSDNAQYRDAEKIKAAGFDYIRLSHYPQSPAFMEACDSLGLVVADAILGWQYYNENDLFKSHAYQSARDLVRRDRNHPCVMTWEVSLNETKMPISFMAELHKIVHEEYPGDNVFTCGWMSDVYDIYFQARQHRIGHPQDMTFEKPYMVSEYGDWEYYSNNAGLNQHQHSREKRIELSSRQLRSAGEQGLLQQAYNLQESHNDNMNIPATGDSYWVMFDYNRGYHDDIESSGIMDLFRIPKFAYYFYASQSDREPVLKIASYWDENSTTDVTVFSNCDEVKLYLNNKLVASQGPDQNEISKNLNHPPFTFEVGKFKAGKLRADGYTNGKKVMSTTIETPKSPTKLVCWIDPSARPAEAGCNDLVFCYIAAVDKNGTIYPYFDEHIELELDDKVKLINPDGVTAEAGVATALLQIGEEGGQSTLTAKSGKMTTQFTFDIK